MGGERQTSESRSDILIYQAEDGQTKVSVRLEEETAWLSQLAIAELFETSKQNISLHIRNIYEDGELDPEAVVKEYLTTAVDGKRYKVKHYNLDMILAVGYRVRSARGAQARCATTVRHKDALDWANAQYEAFAERRRLEAETRADERYVEDLRTTAKMLKARPPQSRRARKVSPARRKDEAEESNRAEMEFKSHSAARGAGFRGRRTWRGSGVGVWGGSEIWCAEGVAA